MKNEGDTEMKKVFKMVDLDCANCAAKMERAIAAIDGVQSVNVSFLAQKLTIEAEDAKFDAIVKEMVKCVKKVDSECDVILK